MYLKKYIAILALLCSFSAFCNGLGEIKTYIGHIDDKHAIKMTLNIKHNGDIVGYYYYESEKIHIPLDGKLINNKIKLAENLDYSKVFSQGFIGTFSDGHIHGEWADSIRKKKLKFSVKFERKNVPNLELMKLDGTYWGVKNDSSRTNKLKLSYVGDHMFKFEITSDNTDGCSGYMTGLIEIKNNGATYKDAGCDLFKLHIEQSHINITESKCGYHGIQCPFYGDFKKHL